MPSAEYVLSRFCLPAKVRLLAVGQRFGMLEVVEHAHPLKRANGRWAAASIVRCDCGTKRTYKNNALLSGNTTSCGCRTVIHGEARSRGRSAEYLAWHGLKARCENPNDPSFESYGGRGISVCERWSRSYVAFLQDMGRRKPGQSLDRIDVDGDYEPANCRWTDIYTQAQNKRTTFIVHYKGEAMCLTEACRRAGLEHRYVTIHARIKRRGWTLEQALELAPAPARRGISLHRRA